ncbi:MAG: ATP-binding cassette domain-containing protein, partial [Verrucomicrobiae bacterium]|nr:ATP-binding cassette domain-containing protein [Verrucomicrobiae bacterium]
AFVSWQASLLVLVLTPVMIVFFVLVGSVIRRSAQAQEKAFGHLAGQFADRVRTLPTILANHALDAEHAKLAGRLRVYADRTMRVLRTAFLNAAIIDFFASLSIAMLAVFLGLGHLGLASMPGFSGLDLWQSLFILMVAPEYFAPFRRYAEQYHAKAEGEAAAASLDGMLGASAGSGSPLALHGLLPDLPQAGLVALVGASGSGKTTLLGLCAGLDAPSSGTIHLAGQDLGALDEDARARVRNDHVGFIFQNFQLLPTLTAMENVLVPLELRGDGVSPDRAADLLRRVGLGERLHHFPAQLSGGEQQRVALARAFVASPKLLFADEPTGNLDGETAQRVADMVFHLNADAGTALVLVTHDLDLARRCRRILRLKGGTVAGWESPATSATRSDPPGRSP